jgi:membrane protease YdiL (CAAX protease family)
MGASPRFFTTRTAGQRPASNPKTTRWQDASDNEAYDVASEIAQTSQGYDTQPCYGELFAIVVAGALHILAEYTLSTAAARLFNVCAAISFLTYIVWRASKTNRVWKLWGMQSARFWAALKMQLSFALPAMVILVAWGIRANTFPPRATFWLAVALYPIWGIAQQFALQNLLARNLRLIAPSPVLRALLAATLFALAHVPLWPIVLLTFVSGFFFTWLYSYRPNLWAVGLLHGVLGAMAFYFVLGRDPGARVLEYLSGN